MSITLNDLIPHFAGVDKGLLVFVVLALFVVCVYRLVADHTFVGKLIGVALLLLAAWVVSGCNGPTDPLGATSRTRLRTDASVSIAQADANARVAQAQAQEAAAIAQSNAQVITAQTEQNGATARTLAWVTTLPVLLVIIGAIIVGALLVNWHGRIHYERTRQGSWQQLAQPPAYPALTDAQLKLLYEYAATQGQKLTVVNGEYYLSDGQRTVKALLKKEDK